MLFGFTKILARWLGTLEFGAVVIFLGSAGGLLVPQVTHAQAASRDATLADCLRYLRTQIQVYAIEHQNVYPCGNDSGSSENMDAQVFTLQLTGYSDALGRTAGTRGEGNSFGPYISTLPANPINGHEGVMIVNAGKMPEPDESQPYGWIYNARTGEIIANAAGADSDGVAYANY